MKHAIDAIHENGLFRPVQGSEIVFSEGQLVRMAVEDECEPEALRLASKVHEGLSDEDIDQVEKIPLDRGTFFGDARRG